MHSPVRKGFDLIAVGDSTLDVFITIHEATVSCEINKDKCVLCMEYAEKIPVESVIKIPGAGNASNVAVGASRLGMKTALVTIIGRDEVGHDNMKGWEREGVSTKYVQHDQKKPTNYSTVLNFKGERTILVYHNSRTYSLPDIDGASWVYYTSIGKKHEALERQLLAHLTRRPEQKLAFNPGTHQLKRGLKALKPVIARSDLFIINKEEAIRLLADGEKPMQSMLTNFLHLGARIVVITDGSNGAFATDGQNVWFCPIFQVKAIERTGAGDSFATGMIAALFHGSDLKEALRHGAANAWSVVQFIGPQAGLLRKKGMRDTLKRFQHIQPKRQNTSLV